MNPMQAFKLFGLYEKLQAVAKEKTSMKVKVPQLLGLLVSLSATIGLPTLLTNFVHAHAGVYFGLVAAALVLHALMPSVFAAPSSVDAKAVGLDKLGVIVFVCLLCGWCGMAQAQAVPANMQNVYAAGVSLNSGASAPVAGSALYAHSITDAGTYAFTVIDAVPATVKPFTVTTNVGVGVAQKVLTISGVPIYVPTAAGISWSGTNTGWQWNTGALASIHLKGSYYIMPSLRVLKSSVSNGSGYQPIVGVMFAWGK